MADVVVVELCPLVVAGSGMGSGNGGNGIPQPAHSGCFRQLSNASGSPYFGLQSQYDGHVGGAVAVGDILPVVLLLVDVTVIVKIDVAVTVETFVASGIVVEAMVLYEGISTDVVLAVVSFVTVSVRVDVAVTVVVKSVIVKVARGTTAVLVVPLIVSV